MAMDFEKFISEHLADKPLDLSETLLFLICLGLGIVAMGFGIWLANRAEAKKKNRP